MMSFRPMLMAALAALTLAGCGGSATSATSGTGASSASVPLPANAPALEQAYVSVVGKVLPSVVQITTDRALGSGVVFNTQGHIVTNAHVVGQQRRSTYAWPTIRKRCPPR
jgi:S1-C subfamily serine protease